jgi:hypothetical protein
MVTGGTPRFEGFDRVRDGSLAGTELDYALAREGDDWMLGVLLLL